MRYVDNVLVNDGDIVYSESFLQAKGYGASYTEITEKMQESGKTPDEIEERLDALEDEYIKWCAEHNLIAN